MEKPAQVPDGRGQGTPGRRGRVPENLPPQPKPPWLKKKIVPGQKIFWVKGLIQEEGLHTVCQEAHCPNQAECFSGGTATFLLMGDRCTRNCSFCAVSPGLPEPLDAAEPARVARAIRKMGLTYAVLTSVTRDDLPDGGGNHFKETVLAVRKENPQTRIECLIPDFQGSEKALAVLAESRPAVINHNLETVPRLYAEVRPGANYRRSLSIFWSWQQKFPAGLTKSGIMVGLGENEKEILALLEDLREQGCALLTIGQYLQPGPGYLPVKRYVAPEEFAAWGAAALKMGFKAVASGPWVRSSFQAARMYEQALTEKR
ncbi:MAG: lipoyl synthase [Deltaproteobacteria bacterium]|nr:lipoyl synthase [Deltaproteobacteria bacterium]